MQSFERYSWDQTKKAVTIYLPVEEDGEVECIFGTRSVEVKFAGKEFKIRNLCQAIDPDKSKWTKKPTRLQLKLMKFFPDDWSDLTDEKDQKDAERKKRIETGDLKGASTQELLADLYKNATDEEREGLKSAALEGQKVRASK